jgi:hypothetical protein
MGDSGHCLSRQVTAASVSDRDTCIRWLRHTDPDADALMEVFATMPEGEWRAMFERALIEGMRAIPQPPPELQAFFSGLEQVPRWVDRDQCNLGGATFLRCRLGFVALAMLSLPLIYSWPAGNKPLALSGQLVHRASQRLKDTTRYVFAVSQADGLARFSEGFRMTARVRLIHAQVRRLLIQSGQWNAEIWGAPINQLHMAGTNLMFSVGVLAGLTRLGYRFDPAEREALVHLWRYAGHLLGVESELLAFSEHEGQKLLDMIFASEPMPDDDSRNLTDALMQTAFEYVRGFKSARFATVNLCYGISRALIGDERADRLAYPKTAWSWLVPAIRPATWLVETARIFSTRVQALARVAGPKAFRHLLSERGLKGRSREFPIPRRIAVRSSQPTCQSEPESARDTATGGGQA